MAAETGGARGTAPARTRERRPARKRGLGAVGAFLLFGAGPVGAVVWFLAQPAWRRQELLERVPEGAGGRAIKAGICVLVLVGLARVALPAFHGTAAALRAGLGGLRAKPKALRVLLFPVEAVLWFLWFGVQALFAVDAVLIVAAALATLLLVARILKPDLLSDVLPDLLR